MLDKIKYWMYESNQKKSKGGLIFMSVAGAVFVGVLIYVFV